MNKTFFRNLLTTIVFVSCSQTFAQIHPLGLYEGMMGNSGVAISDSTAASFYNPSLLNRRQKNSISLGGNTISNYISNSDGTRWSSAKLMPSYLSTVQVFDNFMHEFFLANVLSIQSRIGASENGIDIDQDFRLDAYYAGYSFAFKDFPFGFQVGARVFESSVTGFAEARTATTAYTGKVNSTKRRVEMIFGAGGNHKLKDYTLGYRYVSRGMKVYEKFEGTLKNFVYDSNANSYTVSETSLEDTMTAPQGESIVIGHGFKSGGHEFLTDSQFNETSDLTHTYDWLQSFGYKYSSKTQHQFMCGLAHQISDKVKYFGQSALFSAGYSWLSNTNRSAVGLFYVSNKLEQDTYTYGLTFSSEFIY